MSVFLLFSQLMLTKSVPVQNGTNVRNVGSDVNANKGKINLLIWLAK